MKPQFKMMLMVFGGCGDNDDDVDEDGDDEYEKDFHYLIAQLV